MNKPTLYILCGLPGSGKTTEAKKIERDKNAVRLCPDEWIENLLEDPNNISERDRIRKPVETMLWQLAKRLLQTGNNVIVENGLWTKEERDSYREEAIKTGARVELYFLNYPIETLWNRLDQRNKVLEKPTFRMTREELEEWQKLFQPPTEYEARLYDYYVEHK